MCIRDSDMAQLIVLLQQLKAAVVLFLDDGGQTAAQERQMLFNGIHLARCIGVEVLAHVRCCPAHDLSLIHISYAPASSR